MDDERPHLRPPGAGELATRALAGDAEAALELCRRDPFPSLTALIKEYFKGQLTKASFDLIADSFDRAALERAVDSLDDQVTEPAKPQ